MPIIDMVLIAVGLSMDAFAVSVCKGLSAKRINWCLAFLTAFSFGLFQAVMPTIGWLLGESVRWVIEPIDHWVAFGLLAIIGLKMLIDAFHEDNECPECENENTSEILTKKAVCEILLLSVATSIDALVAGISFSMASIDIVPVVVVIGLTTLILSLAGFAVGNRFGAKFKRGATIMGGVALLALGIKILFEHLA